MIRLFPSLLVGAVALVSLMMMYEYEAYMIESLKVEILESRNLGRSSTMTAGSQEEDHDHLIIVNLTRSDGNNESSSSSHLKSIGNQESETQHVRSPGSSNIVLLQEDSSKNWSSAGKLRNCTSPERTVAWPMGGGGGTATVKSRSSPLTCGLNGSNSTFSQHIRDHTLPVLAEYEKECHRLVVYGVAFGPKYVKKALTKQTRQYLNATELIRNHGHCFFMFCLEEDLPAKYKDSGSDKAMMGHTRFIGIPRSVLPYDNLRRSVKLLKFHGHLLFPKAERIVWQDAKFFDDSRVRKQPVNYFMANYHPQACLSVITLPVHANTFGSRNIERAKMNDEPTAYRPKYIDHCRTIIGSLEKRPSVTDSVDNLVNQCQSYLLLEQQRQQQQEGQPSLSSNSTTRFLLDYGLLDSAYLVWNQFTGECRKFNAELQCTISDELQCHSDRDQVAFPFAFAQMGLRVKKRTDEAVLDQRRNDLELVVDDGTASTVAVHMTKSTCHWYYRSLNNCSKLSIDHVI